MHGLRGITGQGHPPAGNAAGHSELERHGQTRSAGGQPSQAVAEGLGKFSNKSLVVQLDQPGGSCMRLRPHGHQVVPDRQHRHRAIGRKTLPRHLVMRQFGMQACQHRALLVIVLAIADVRQLADEAAAVGQYDQPGGHGLLLASQADAERGVAAGSPQRHGTGTEGHVDSRCQQGSPGTGIKVGIGHGAAHVWQAQVTPVEHGAAERGLLADMHRVDRRGRQAVRPHALGGQQLAAGV